MPRKLPSPSEDKWKTMDYRRMETEALSRLLLDRMNELEREGVIDHYFSIMYSLKEDSGPSFFIDLIPVFFTDVHTVVNDMEKILCEQVVDFNQMYSLYIKIKGSSSCFGACRIRDACFDLGHAVDNNSKDGCLQALNTIRDERKSLQEKLESIIKMERELVARETAQP